MEYKSSVASKADSNPRERLTVRAVSALSGVSPHKLRAWERRYSAVRPSRTSTGRRSYTMADVEKLALLHRLTAQGHAIGSVAALSLAELQKLGHRQQRVAGTVAPEARAVVESVLAALTRFRLDELSRELLSARMSLSVRSFILRVVGALMAEVGLRVSQGRMNIAQEHALSAMLRDHLGQILNSIPTVGASGPRVTIATSSGDLHEFGILTSAILCASHGLRVNYLGPNLPAADLAQAARATGSDFVLVGSLPIPEANRARPLEAYLKELRAALPVRTGILLGGFCDFDLRRSGLARVMRHLATLDELDELLAEISKTTVSLKGAFQK